MSERHDYKLLVKLKNLGTESLGAYHIDMEMPARVVNRPTDHYLYVPSRSTSELVFFRVSSKNHAEEVFRPVTVERCFREFQIF